MVGRNTQTLRAVRPRRGAWYSKVRRVALAVVVEAFVALLTGLLLAGLFAGNILVWRWVIEAVR